jgi:hypothetical protein
MTVEVDVFHTGIPKEAVSVEPTFMRLGVGGSDAMFVAWHPIDKFGRQLQDEAGRPLRTPGQPNEIA